MENVTKEICSLTHKQLNKTIDRLTENIDRAVEIASITSKEVYLLCGKIKEIDQLEVKVDKVSDQTIRNTTLWKIFAVVGSLSVITLSILRILF